MKNITIDGVEYNITPVIKEIKKDYEILSLKSIHSTIVIDYKNGGGAYIKGTFEAIYKTE